MIDAVLSSEERRVILVDGFNVLHAVLQKAEREAGWWKREQRERLLRRVAKWPTAEDEVWVAFDGTQPAWSVWAESVWAGSVRAESVLATPIAGVAESEGQPLEPQDAPTVHSVYVESADDWIVRRARRSPYPDRTIVVTRDRNGKLHGFLNICRHRGYTVAEHDQSKCLRLSCRANLAQRNQPSLYDRQPASASHVATNRNDAGSKSTSDQPSQLAVLCRTDRLHHLRAKHGESFA